MLLKELSFLETLGLYQRWEISIKYESTLNHNAIGSEVDTRLQRRLIALLRMWPEGGVTGVVLKGGNGLEEKETPEFLFGDVFGSWNVEGISFSIMVRSTEKRRVTGQELNAKKVKDSIDLPFAYISFSVSV